ncbi:MAG: hypothetical protein HOQ21_10105 [Dermatophilaceae bacterium]|nr:hypothetical protein [Dermatophilaceae bacterium]
MSSWFTDALKACMPAIRKNLDRAMAEAEANLLDRALARSRGNTISPAAPIRVAAKPATQPAMPPQLRQDLGVSNADELVQWMRQQIAEKRRRAMATAFLPDDPAPAWTYDEYEHRVVIQADDHQVGVASHRSGTTPTGAPYDDLVLNADGSHMELNDPQAAVAECDAHTTILDLHPERSDGSGLCNECRDPYPCGTIRALGLAYQHRPGYLDAWRWRP